MAISDLKGSINAKIKTNGSQSITGAVLNEVLNEMVDELDVTSEINNKVDKGDYAPALTAGFADNLISKDIVVDSEFNLRRSGGGAISDGVARMEVVKGNSVVWNQQLNNAYQASGIGGWCVRQGQDKAEFSDNSVTWSFVSGVSASPELTQFVGFTKGHKYLFVTEYKLNWVDGGNEFYLIVRQTAGPANSNLVGLGTIGTGANQGTASFFFESQHDDKPYLTLVTYSHTNNIGESATLTKARLIDLTQMFGAGNEPTTIEEYYARKPIVEDEYAYNEGEVIHCNVDAVKSVGRNLFNIQNIQVGGVNDVTGAVNNDADSYNTGYVNVLPNTAYYIRTDATSGRWGAWYDSDKQYISGIAGGGLKTSPSNAAYLRMTIVSDGDGNPETFYINLSDPDFNGQYEPYKEDVRELPSAIKEVFPNGMMSAGTAHDVAYNDLNKEVGVTEKRIGVVDLGILNWYKGANGRGNILWKAANLNDLGIATNNNILCNQYVTRTSGEIYWNGLIGINVHDEANGMYFLFLYDPQYDDYDVASFKAAMAGVQLYYELATPIVTEHQEPFNLDYQVTNGGQEQAMATEPTSAFKAEIAYGFNAAAKIKENANEIAQLKATIAQLQAALASMVNENVEDYE